MSDRYFTPEKVIDLVVNHTWALVNDSNQFRLIQVGNEHMKTELFDLSGEDLAAVYSSLEAALQPTREESKS